MRGKTRGKLKFLKRLPPALLDAWGCSRSIRREQGSCSNIVLITVAGVFSLPPSFPTPASSKWKKGAKARETYAKITAPYWLQGAGLLLLSRVCKYFSSCREPVGFGCPHVPCCSQVFVQAGSVA